MYIADLHIHSKYSRATSRDCDAPRLDLWARRKGIGLVGTGDFTHPAWRAELREALEPAGEGVYRLKPELRLPCETEGEPLFVVSGEISTIYKRGGKTRKVHHVILLPGLEAAEDLAQRLEAVGNIRSDGRPILGLDSRDLLELTLDCCPQAVYIPAHIWTPHFSLFGAFSDFSTLEECYGDLAGEVHALETGLSSDPPMNRRLSMLDRYTLVSNSDAHSPARLGREANLLDGAPSYPALRRALQTGDGLLGTVEFYPEEGKYHLDGHRRCRCCLEPARTAELGGLCPVCGRALTVGVLSRVEQLADRDEPAAIGKPFESLIPLTEVLAGCMGVSPASRRVQEAYFSLLSRLGPEMSILRELDTSLIEREAGFAVAEGVRRMRAGRVICKAGYDGEYGVISLFEPGELEMLSGQTSFMGLAGLTEAPHRRRSPATAAAQGAEAAEAEPAAASNPEQEEAVRSTDACTAVIAGPGTGKTRTLVDRIAWLIEERGASPREITAVTFTRQAAAEMLERLTRRLGKRAVKGLTVGTFHAVCMRLVPPKPLISRARALEEMTALMRERGEGLSPGEALRLLSLYKSGLRARTPALAALPAWLPDAYGERLRALGVRDLDDLLLDALDVETGQLPMFRYLLVDEYQDVNAVQRALVAHWSGQGSSLFVIGDPDQAIYGFRGADADCFARLLDQRPDARVVTLRRNYRSTPQVLDAATRVISRNPGGARAIVPTRPDGARLRVAQAADPFSEGVWIAKEIARMAGGMDMLESHRMGRDSASAHPFSDIAVLCRTRRQLERIEGCLVHDSIPCVVSGRSDDLDDAAVQGLLGFFASLRDPRDAAALAACLGSLWRVPAPLCQRAAAALAMSAGEAEIAAALRRELKAFPPLAPWLDAVEALLPRMAREKPRRLLEDLRGRAGAEGRPVERLLSTAVFHTAMDDLLDTLAAGEDADVRRAAQPGTPSGAVRLMTLHAAKGMEFPVVFLAGVSQGDLPLVRNALPADEAEERRLFFVGMTRARDELILTCGGEPSPFLADVPGKREFIRPRSRPERVEQLTLF